MDIMDVLDELCHEYEDVEMIDASEKAFILDEIDPYMTELEPQTAPVEELKSFLVGLWDLAKILKVGKGLSTEIKEKLNDFLSRKFDVFAWRREDVMGIDPKVSCHHLKIDPKTVPHRQKRRVLN